MTDLPKLDTADAVLAWSSSCHLNHYETATYIAECVRLRQAFGEVGKFVSTSFAAPLNLYDWLRDAMEGDDNG